MPVTAKKTAPDELPADFDFKAAPDELPADFNPNEVKKKDDTKTTTSAPSAPLIFKSPSKSGEGTSANEAYGTEQLGKDSSLKPGALPIDKGIPDYELPAAKKQREALELKKKMFDTLANKKVNLARAEQVKTKILEVAPQLETKKRDIEKANIEVNNAIDDQSQQLALEKKAKLEAEHDQLALQHNGAIDQYNIYNKAVVQDEKLINALAKVMESKPSGAKSTSSAAIFGKTLYNATLPSLVHSLGTIINAAGEVPAMLGGAEMPEGTKATDKIGDLLTGWGDAIKTDVPDEATTDIWTKPTPENVAATAGSLIGNLINVIGTGAVGGMTSSAATGVAMSVDESFGTFKDAGMSDKESAMLALPIGLINGAMDVWAVDNILKKFEQKAINKAISKEAIDYLKDKEITQASAIEAVKYAREEVVKQAAKGALKTASKEGVTGAAQSLTQSAGEEISDVATGQDKFKNTAKSVTIDAVKNGILEAAGGGIAGGVFNANPSTKSIYDKAQQLNSDPDGMVTFNKDVDAHIAQGEITEEEGENIKTKMANLIEANNTIPKEINNKDHRIEAIELIQAKNRLKAEVDQLDPAMLGDRKKSITQIEDLLKHIAAGDQDKYSYVMDVDTGKYYQIDESDKRDEITKEVFDLAIRYRRKAKGTLSVGEKLLPKNATSFSGKSNDVISSESIFKNKVEDKDLFGNTRDERVDFINKNEDKIVDEAVNVDDIIPTQSVLDRGAVQKIGDGVAPVLVKMNGKYYVLDGHHRIAAGIKQGDVNIKAKVIDFDANTPKAKEGEQIITTNESNKESGDGKEIVPQELGNEGRKDGEKNDGKNVQGQEVLTEKAAPVSPVISQEQKDKLSKLIPRKDAISLEISNEKVLPAKRPEVGLQEVGARNGEPKEVAKQGEAAKEEVGSAGAVGDVELNKDEKEDIKKEGGKEEDFNSVREYFAKPFQNEGLPNIGEGEGAEFMMDDYNATEEDVSIKDLIPTQRVVDKKAIDSKNNRDDNPIIIRNGNDLFVVDGHHRIAQAAKNGETELKADIFDVTDLNLPTYEQSLEETTKEITPKIVQDAAENESIAGKLAEQDNSEQEPSVKIIESKGEDAKGISDEELQKGIANSTELIDQATGVKVVKASTISTDESRFQNRDKLNEDVVNEIANNWKDADQDPIHIWTDPKDGKTYVLSGHHRLAGAIKAGRENVKIIDRTKDFTEAQAIKFATEDANANRTMESALERAKALRIKKERGESKDEINKFLEREGKNKVFVNNISALNPKGKTMLTLIQFSDAGDKQTQKELEQRADWIGEARRTILGLTDAHENELFDFLFNKDLSKRVTNKSDFLQKVRSTINPMDLEAPLNIARFKTKTQGEQSYDDTVDKKKSEISDVQGKINVINDRFSDPNRSDYISTDSRDFASARKIADDKVAELDVVRKKLQKELETIYREKGKYTGAPTTGDLFDIPETEKEIALREIDEAQKKLRDKLGGTLSSGGLQALPEFIEVVRAYIKYGIVTAKDFIAQFRKDFPDADVEDKDLAEAFISIQDKTSGATHAQTAEIRDVFGMDEYNKIAETQKGWEDQADKEIANGYDINALLSKLEKDYIPTPVEQKILAKYIATLNAIASADPSDENMANLRRAINVSETSAGTALGKSLAARAGAQKVSESLADFFLQQEQASGTEGLTDEQKLQNTKEFNEISAAKLALEEKVAQLQDELNRKEAEGAVKGIKRNQRKTREDFVAERKNIVSDIREKLKKARSETNVTPVPYAKELIVITPDVVRLMRSYVEEGLTKLADITKAIHDEFKQDIPELTEKDVVDIIAGKYNEKPKKTANELRAKIKDIKDEAMLIAKLEGLQNGEVPVSEKKKIERSKEITELRAKIKENDLTKLSEAKNRLKNQAEKLEKDLAEGNYAPKPKSEKIELDKEGNAIKDRYIKAKQERQVRLWKDAYENRSKYQKALDAVTEVANIPRALMSSMDFSAPLRQGLIQTVSNPKMAAKAFKTMFEHAASQENFDRWMYDLKESPEWDIMNKSKLFIVDPHDPVLAAKDEQFMSNLASKIPFIGTSLIKGSERAYVSYLNKMRVDVFKRYMDAFESEGKTFENSPELYKAMASYINASTGRGGLGSLENAAQPLATAFFSPRLIASRLNLLLSPISPKFYLDTPKEVRVAYFKDMSKFLGAGMMTLALAALAGAEVEDDPRSSDFGKIKIGDTRIDIWGGFTPYVRILAQLITGQTKNATSKQIQELDTKDHNRGTLLMRFGRQKLSPIPATATNLVTGYDFMGDRTEITKELTRMLPLTPMDIAAAVKDQGVSSILTVGVPSTFGISVNRYKDKTFVKPDDSTITGVFEMKDYVHKNYRQKKIFISKDQNAIIVSKEQEEQVNTMRNENAEKAIKKVLPELKKMPADVFKDAVNIIYARYEKEAKDKVFGDKWHDDKIEDKSSEQKTKEKASISSILNKIPQFHDQEKKDKKRMNEIKSR